MTNAMIKSTDWLRRRQLGIKQGVPSLAKEQVMRLKLEKVLTGHNGSVNCLEWNSTGQILASGSDDSNVVLWYQPVGYNKKINVIKTSHQSSIFSVKFIPNSSDELVVTCSADRTVKVTNTSNNRTILDCQSCHRRRVKKLAVQVNDSNLFWSVGEDGKVMEYDLRARHTCESGQSLMLDLTHFLPDLKGKCLATHPLREELIAVGTTNSYVFLFDRRRMPRDRPNTSAMSTHYCVAYFSPGSPTDPMERAQLLRLDSYPVSSVVFSANGKELLANINKGQIYLFNIEEPDEQYKSFDLSIEQLLQDTNQQKQVPSHNKPSYFRFQSKSEWQKLKTKKPTPMTDETSHLVGELKQKMLEKKRVRKADHDKLNELLIKHPACVELYNSRASLLMLRSWHGDWYQALRDTCCALALDPLNNDAIINLLSCSDHIGELGTYFKLMKTLGRNYGDIIKEEVLARLERHTNQRIDNVCESTKRDFSIFSAFTSYPKAGIVTANLWESRANYRFISDCFPNSKRYYPSPDYVHPYDYSKRFCGHCNTQTDIKEANFFGLNQEYIVSGSDDGAFYIWDRQTTNLVKACQADLQVVNCLQPHPSDLSMATSGTENTVKIWSPSGTSNTDVMAVEQRCSQNQAFLNDPWDNLFRLIFN